jgi:hypothetical protein
MHLKETYSEIHVSKYLPGAYTIQKGVQQKDVSATLLSTLL